MIEAPYEVTPAAPEQPAGRVILDLSTLPPEIIDILVSLGAIDPNGQEMTGAMNVMRQETADPRVEAIQRAIGAGAAQVPSGF